MQFLENCFGLSTSRRKTAYCMNAQQLLIKKKKSDITRCCTKRLFLSKVTILLMWLLDYTFLSGFTFAMKAPCSRSGVPPWTWAWGWGLGPGGGEEVRMIPRALAL